MRRLRELIVRLGGLFNKQRWDRELDDEIESHLQMHIEDNLRLGMTPEEARRQARLPPDCWPPPPWFVPRLLRRRFPFFARLLLAIEYFSLLQTMSAPIGSAGLR